MHGHNPEAGGAGLPTPGRAFDDRTFDAVLFDMDGTLIDSAASAQRCWRRWAREFGLPDAETFEVQHGIPASQVVPTLLPAEQVEAGVARILELEIADATGIHVLPGAELALGSLRPGQAAIVTSCTHAQAWARINGSGLEPPEVVVTADDVERGKPYPDPFRLGARALGVDPRRCLVIEDAPAGVTAALAAGCAVLGVGGRHGLSLLGQAHAGASGLDRVGFAVGPAGIAVGDRSPQAG
ncbi:HAD-IA family hydrolase [Pseudactinotalea sp. Z1748]|uniref:HAD-IA family hydrolase n=1 Tax=Pseudactinotalea sp. Z1748 TaxID=3413027 RepID=UPI003C7B89B7